MCTSYPRGNEGGVLSEAGFSGWVGGWVEVVVRIGIWGIMGCECSSRPQSTLNSLCQRPQRFRYVHLVAARRPYASQIVRELPHPVRVK